MTNEETQDVELEEQNDELEEDQEEDVVEESEEEDESEDESNDAPDWEAEAKKWKAIAERKKKNINNKLSTNKAESPDVDGRIAQLELAEKKRQFGYEHGLSPVETDRIFQISQDPDESVLKDPFVKAGLKALRAKERLEDNSPSISAKSKTFQSKELSNMSKEQKQAEFEKFMKSKGVID